MIGTASLRRQAQLKAINPTFQCVNFRGNVQTRLKKLGEGIVDATLLAKAGLNRMGMDEHVPSGAVIVWVGMYARANFFVPDFGRIDADQNEKI